MIYGEEEIGKGKEGGGEGGRKVSIKSIEDYEDDIIDYERIIWVVK